MGDFFDEVEALADDAVDHYHKVVEGAEQMIDDIQNMDTSRLNAMVATGISKSPSATISYAKGHGGAGIPKSTDGSVLNTEFTENAGMDQETFLHFHRHQANMADRGVVSTDSRRVSAESMEYIDANFDNQSSQVQKAYTDIMENPQHFGMEVEDNNIIEQAMGQGDHDYKEIPPAL